MKQIICIFFIMYAHIFLAQQKRVEADEVRLLMKIQQDYWNAGDLNGFMKYYYKSDSLMFIGSKGINYGWHKVLENYKTRYPNKESMGELKFELIRVSELSEQSMYVVGKWQLKKESPVSGFFTLLWKKINGQWLIICDHTS